MELSWLKEYSGLLFSSLERTKKALIPQELVFTTEGIFAPSHSLLTYLKVPVDANGSVQAHELQKLIKTFSKTDGVELEFNKTSVTLANGSTQVRLALTPFDISKIKKPSARDFRPQYEIGLSPEFMRALELALKATKLRYVNNGFLAGVHLYKISDTSIILAGTDGSALAGAQVTCDYMPIDYLLLPISFCRQLITLGSLGKEQAVLAWNDNFILARGGTDNPCEVIGARLDTNNKELLKEADVLGLTLKVFDALENSVLVEIPDDFTTSLRRLEALRPRGGKLECEISVHGDELMLCANNGNSEVVETFKPGIKAAGTQTLMADIESIKGPGDEFRLLGLLDWALAYSTDDFSRFYVISARKVD